MSTHPLSSTLLPFVMCHCCPSRRAVENRRHSPLLGTTTDILLLEPPLSIVLFCCDAPPLSSILTCHHLYPPQQHAVSPPTQRAVGHLLHPGTPPLPPRLGGWKSLHLDPCPKSSAGFTDACTPSLSLFSQGKTNRVTREWRRCTSLYAPDNPIIWRCFPYLIFRVIHQEMRSSPNITTLTLLPMSVQWV